mgnify:CR=1 FL=1
MIMKKLTYLLLSITFLFTVSCEENETIHGCVDSHSCNYNPNANLDNNSCIYSEEGLECGEGCMDENAINYDENAYLMANCCFNCFDGNSTLLGYYCGGFDSESVIENNFSGPIQLWTLFGEFVPPGTNGGLLAFNQEGSPIIGNWSDFPEFINGISCY